MKSVSAHYSAKGRLADKIEQSLRAAGKDLTKLGTKDLAPIDEFHIRGRTATLEIANQMHLNKDSHILDIGSGLGGPARTVAEEFGCHVTGIDITQEFCHVAETLSGWVRLSDKTVFEQGDATNLPYTADKFDAAMTIHVAMNIPEKNKLYAQALRVVKPGGVFALYDILQGEGGEVLFPVPWARDASISHLATAEEMESLLTDAGFKVVDVHDSTNESQDWFEAMSDRMSRSSGPPPLTFQAFLGEDFQPMVRNQIRNLTERRIRTVSHICTV